MTWTMRACAASSAKATVAAGVGEIEHAVGLAKTGSGSSVMATPIGPTPASSPASWPSSGEPARSTAPASARPASRRWRGSASAPCGRRRRRRPGACRSWRSAFAAIWRRQSAAPAFSAGHIAGGRGAAGKRPRSGKRRCIAKAPVGARGKGTAQPDRECDTASISTRSTGRAARIGRLRSAARPPDGRRRPDRGAPASRRASGRRPPRHAGGCPASRSPCRPDDAAHRARLFGRADDAVHAGGARVGRAPRDQLGDAAGIAGGGEVGLVHRGQHGDGEQAEIARCRCPRRRPPPASPSDRRGWCRSSCRASRCSRPRAATVLSISSSLTSRNTFLPRSTSRRANRARRRSAAAARPCRR